MAMWVCLINIWKFMFFHHVISNDLSDTVEPCMLKSDTCLAFALNEFVARWDVLFTSEKGAGRAGCYVSRRKFPGSIFASQVRGLFTQQCESKHISFWRFLDLLRLRCAHKTSFSKICSRVFLFSDVRRPFVFLGLQHWNITKIQGFIYGSKTYLILVKFWTPNVRKYVPMRKTGISPLIRRI